MNSTDTSLDSICKAHDILVRMTGTTLSFTCKDGKKLIYAVWCDGMTIDNAIKYALDNKFHGRIFSKDGKFLGYIPEASTVEELLICLDLNTAE